MNVSKFEIRPKLTYKTRENAEKAVEKAIEKFYDLGDAKQIRYFIHTHTDGRFFPVFVGFDAMNAGVHFHFNVIA